MRRALIIVNPYTRLQSGLNQAERLRKEFANLGVSADIKRNGLFAWIGDGGKISTDVKDYDFCVYLDKDKYSSALLEKAGLRLFNSHAAVRVCDDKMNTHVALAENGVPMPPTVAGLLCYDKDAEISEEHLHFAESALGYPVVVKECYGSLGKGVYKADGREELLSLARKLKCTPHLYQKFIAASAGRDVRAIAVGGKVIAAMERKSNGDFRSNLELGASAKPFEITPKLKDICGATAKILKTEYCGIDLLFDGKGGFLVCEVNSNAFFGGIERITGVNIAKTYAEYILKEVYGNA